MLKTAPIRAYIPVSDLARARKFYEQTIGLEPKHVVSHAVLYECGGAEVFMYVTPNAGTSKASQAFWQVADVEAEVADLKARGVQHRDRWRRKDRMVQGHRRQHHGGEPGVTMSAPLMRAPDVAPAHP
jgi:extradiol dioxygenase family protein